MKSRKLSKTKHEDDIREETDREVVRKVGTNTISSNHSVTKKDSTIEVNYEKQAENRSRRDEKRNEDKERRSMTEESRFIKKIGGNTRVCNYFMRGACFYGTRCRFSHDGGEERRNRRRREEERRRQESRENERRRDEGMW